MKLKTRIIIALLVLMLIPTLAFAKEITDGQYFKMDIPDEYELIGTDQYRKPTGENFSITITKPLAEDKTKMSDEEFEYLVKAEMESINSQDGYSAELISRDVVSFSKNNYTAYQCFYRIHYLQATLYIKQYYILGKEKICIITDTRLTEEQFNTEEAKSLFDSFTLMNITTSQYDVKEEKPNLITEKEDTKLIAEKEDETKLIAEKDDENLIAKKEESLLDNKLLPIVLVLVIVIVVLIIKMAAKKPKKEEDKSNL